MSPRISDDLVRELSSGLEPVRRIPPLRAVLAGTFALAALGAGLRLALTGGPRPDLFAMLTGALPFPALAAALTLVGVGGLLALAAGSVPGRERLARAGAALLVAAAVGALAAAAPAGWRGPTGADLRCLCASLLAAIPAAFAGIAFARRAAPRRPRAMVALAAAGAAGLGGLAVHASCPSPELAHWVLGHASAPLAAALLAAPLALAVARRGGAAPR
jgi:hypothetical protein